MIRADNQSTSSGATFDTATAHVRKMRKLVGRTAPFFLGTLVVLAASCADSPTDMAGPEAGDPHVKSNVPSEQTSQIPRVSAPFGLADVMRRVHFSYRADGGAFQGGHTSYDVRADAHGFVVTPGRTDLTMDPVTHEPPPGMLGSPATFETVSLGRGALLHDAPIGDPKIAEAGHLIMPRGGDIEEQLENTEDGVEQRFAFASRPVGAGDYVIRVRVTGEDYTGQTEHGHHFIDPATGIGLRYGIATWIDARGERTSLRVDYVEEAGELELTVPADVIDASAYPAVLDPYVSPEMGTDNPILGFVNGNQLSSDVAFDGTNYMVVWLDDQISGRRSVYATRVSPGGTLLSPDAILVRTNVDPNKPAIAFNGTDFLVAWSESVSPVKRVYVVRLSGTGTVLSSPTQLAAPVSEDATRPDIAFDGTNHLVVYTTRYSAGSDNVYGQRVSSTGATVGSLIAISTAGSDERIPTVAFDGTNYLVAWHDRRNNTAGDIYAARVTKTGTNLDPTGIAISTAANGQSEPDIAFDGANYLVVWEDAKWGGGRDIYGSFITPAGVVMNPSGFEISKSLGDESTPGIAFDGTRYVVAWGDTRNGNADVYAARVLPAGVVLDPMGIQVTSNAAAQNDLSVGCGGGNCLMVFTDQRAPTTSVSSDIWGARINASGTMLDTDGFPISRSANEQIKPVVVRGNGQYLAAWQDHRAFSNWDIYGTRIDSSGNAIDLNGIAISTAAGDQLEPDVAWNGTDWFVAWEDRRNAATGDIYGARVDGTGTALDTNGVAISATTNTERQAAVAFDGTNHMVVWNDSRTSSGDIYGVRVSMTGTVVDANAILLGQSSSEDVYPEIAYDGTNYLVAWCRPTTVDALGRRVSPAGTLLDSVNGFKITQASGTEPIDVVYDGLNFFVVASRSGTIYGGRVTSAGVPLEPSGFAIASPTGGFAQSQPGITRDGQGVFIAWRSTNSSTSENMIRGTWISQAGDISHLGGFVLSNIPSFDHSRPVAAADGAGNVLVAYQRNAMNGVAAAHERTYVRLISTLTNGLACTDNAACLSGFCVDGVCCNSGCGGGNLGDCLGCSVAVGAAANGTCGALDAVPCNDGNACTMGDTCMTGVCMSGGPNPCLAPDDCHLDGTCNTMTGMCTNAVKPNGSACEDGNLCTQSGSCTNGTCMGSNPVSCPIDTQCNTVGLCDPMTGMCPVDDEPDGTACIDNEVCTATSECQLGLCVGVDPVVCPPEDQCHHPGACIAGAGGCVYPNKADGTSCNDGTACSQTDACQAGVCVGMNSVVCPMPTSCTDVAACNPVTGTCAVTMKQDGTVCNDGNGCTQTDTCAAGQCVGSSPVICAPPGQCHQGVVCDTATGQCNYSDKPNGTVCNDGNACTMVDTCTAGACAGASPIICTTPDACHDAGACDSATGMCPTPVVKADGTPCPGGTCMAGTCQSNPGTGGGGGMGGSTSASSSGSSNGVAGSGGVMGSSSSSGMGGQTSSSGMGGNGGKEPSSSSGDGGGRAGSGGSIPSNPDGCSCRMTGTTPVTAPFATFGAAIWLLARRRRNQLGGARVS